MAPPLPAASVGAPGGLSTCSRTPAPLALGAGADARRAGSPSWLAGRNGEGERGRGDRSDKGQPAVTTAALDKTLRVSLGLRGKGARERAQTRPRAAPEHHGRPGCGGAARPRLPACGWGPQGAARMPSPRELGATHLWRRGPRALPPLARGTRCGPAAALRTSCRASLLAVMAQVAVSSPTHLSLAQPRQDADVGREGGLLGFPPSPALLPSPWESITQARGLCPQLVGTGGLSHLRACLCWGLPGSLQIRARGCGSGCVQLVGGAGSDEGPGDTWMLLQTVV